MWLCILCPREVTSWLLERIVIRLTSNSKNAGRLLVHPSLCLSVHLYAPRPVFKSVLKFSQVSCEEFYLAKYFTLSRIHMLRWNFAWTLRRFHDVVRKWDFYLWRHNNLRACLQIIPARTLASWLCDMHRVAWRHDNFLWEIHELIYRSSQKLFIAKKQSGIELMMEKDCKKKKNFTEDADRAVRARRGVLEILESVMKPNGLT